MVNNVSEAYRCTRACCSTISHPIQKDTSKSFHKLSNALVNNLSQAPFISNFIHDTNNSSYPLFFQFACASPV